MNVQKKLIRTLVVDDSLLFRKVLVDRLSKHTQIEIVGSAANAFEAEQKIKDLKPDVVTLDVEMPRMNGIDFLKKIMPISPVRVILVSSLNISVFEALSYDAVDFVQKPDMASGDSDHFFGELTRKIVIASMAKLPAKSKAAPQMKLPPMLLKNAPALKDIVIALGASTGGTEATLEVLRGLPAYTPGILVVQHMPPGFTKMYAQRLDSLCKMNVREAKSGDRIEQGTVLIAPGDAHLKVVKVGGHYTVNCVKGPKVSGHCPSVDVLFDSVAEQIKGEKVGIILTGMGQDGAHGLLNMKKNGAYTIGQDKESSVVYGMPMVAYNIGAVKTQAAIGQVANALIRHLNKLVG